MRTCRSQPLTATILALCHSEKLHVRLSRIGFCCRLKLMTARVCGADETVPICYSLPYAAPEVIAAVNRGEPKQVASAATDM